MLPAGDKLMGDCMHSVTTVCDDCRSEARLVTSVAAFGSSPGARFYQCAACGHLQIEEFTTVPIVDRPRTDYRQKGA